MALGVGSESYNRPLASSTVSTSIPTSFTVGIAETSGNEVITITKLANLDTANVAQVSTVTLATPTVGNTVALTVTANSVSNLYFYVVQTGDTATSVAAYLAKIIGAVDPNVSASAAAGVITLTSIVPGQAFTLANTGSTTPSNVVIATTTANSGTPLQVQTAIATLTFSVDSNGFQSIALGGNWYTGATTPVVAAAIPTLSAKTPVSYNTMQTNNGILPPA